MASRRAFCEDAHIPRRKRSRISGKETTLNGLGESTNITSPLDISLELRCPRKGSNNNWCCSAMVVPGKAFCEQHCSSELKVYVRRRRRIRITDEGIPIEEGGRAEVALDGKEETTIEGKMVGGDKGSIGPKRMTVSGYGKLGGKKKGCVNMENVNEKECDVSRICTKRRREFYYRKGCDDWCFDGLAHEKQNSCLDNQEKAMGRNKIMKIGLVVTSFALILLFYLFFIGKLC